MILTMISVDHNSSQFWWILPQIVIFKDEKETRGWNAQYMHILAAYAMQHVITETVFLDIAMGAMTPKRDSK